MKAVLKALNGNKTVIGLAVMQFAQFAAEKFQGDLALTVLYGFYLAGMILAGVGVVHKGKKMVKE